MHVDWNELPPRPAELKHEAVASTCAVEVPPSNKHHNGWKEMIPSAKHVPKEADTPVVNVSCMCAFIMCTRLWKDRQGSCYQWKKYFFPSLSLESKKATRSRSFIFGLSTIEEVCSLGFFFWSLCEVSAYTHLDQILYPSFTCAVTFCFHCSHLSIPCFVIERLMLQPACKSLLLVACLTYFPFLW